MEEGQFLILWCSFSMETQEAWLENSRADTEKIDMIILIT